MNPDDNFIEEKTFIESAPQTDQPSAESPTIEPQSIEPPVESAAEYPPVEPPVEPIIDSGTIIMFMAIVIVMLSVVVIYLINRLKKANASIEKARASAVSTKPSKASKPIFRVGNINNIGRRKEQQDAFCVSDIRDEKILQAKGALAVVADGMGGMDGGAAISRLVTNTFLKQYDAQNEIANPTKFLHDTAQTAETEVEKYMNRRKIDGGSTVAAVLIKNGEMNFISVGDSIIYLLRGHELRQLNREHNFGAVLKEKARRGEVDPDEPFTNPRRNALTSYIGMGSLTLVDKSAQSIRLVADDKIILCSDGVVDALSDKELIELLDGEAAFVAGSLEKSILSKNLPQQDNFTCVILEYVNSEE